MFGLSKSRMWSRNTLTTSQLVNTWIIHRTAQSTVVGFFCYTILTHTQESAFLSMSVTDSSITYCDQDSRD